MVRKVNDEGRVAVLISPGFGAGWSTWAGEEYAEEVLFDPGLVQLVVNGASREEL